MAKIIVAQLNDSFESIARRYGVDLAELKALNANRKGIDANHPQYRFRSTFAQRGFTVHPGDTIRLPEQCTVNSKSRGHKVNPISNQYLKLRNSEGRPVTQVKAKKEQPDDFFENYKTGLDVTDSTLKGIEGGPSGKYYMGWAMTPAQRRGYWTAMSSGMKSSTPVGSVRIFSPENITDISKNNAINIGGMAKGVGGIVGAMGKTLDVKEQWDALQNANGGISKEANAKYLEIKASQVGGEFGYKAGMYICPKIPNKGGAIGVAQMVGCISIFSWAGSEAAGEGTKKALENVVSVATEKESPTWWENLTPEQVNALSPERRKVYDEIKRYDYAKEW